MKIIWDIYNIKRESETGLVFKVIYLVNAKGGVLTETYKGKLELSGDAASSDFIPFLELDKETVLDWVKTELGPEKVSEIEEELTEKLNLRLLHLVEKTSANGTPWEMKMKKI